MSEYIKLTNEYFKSKDKGLIPAIVRAKVKEFAAKKAIVKKIEPKKKIVSSIADVNKDGVVDEKDLSIVHKEYSKEVKKKNKKKNKKRFFKD